MLGFLGLNYFLAIMLYVPEQNVSPLYHLVKGKVYSSQLKNGFAPTLNGSAVEVILKGGVKINDSKVLYANIWSLNGVIHVIDKVILPNLSK